MSGTLAGYLLCPEAMQDLRAAEVLGQVVAVGIAVCEDSHQEVHRRGQPCCKGHTGSRLDFLWLCGNKPDCFTRIHVTEEAALSCRQRPRSLALRREAQR